MAKNSNQKLKILYLRQILLEETDERHPLTMEELVSRLAAYGVPANRKSIYADMDGLREFGMDILGEKRGKKYVYYVGSRDFELPEVKLLADAVSSARFISEKKSGQLVRKLGTLTSRVDAKMLNREVMSAGKSVNETVYYAVDTLHNAIGAGSRVKFGYFQWNVKKEQELRHGGQEYDVSPWMLVWDDEFYYLVAFDNGKIKHFRVDKMLGVRLTGEKREGREVFEKLDRAAYTKGMFGMFSGEKERVSLKAENRFAGILIDRFGTDIFMYPADAEHFKASVDVHVSGQFFSWVFSLGEGIRITGPEKVLKQASEIAERLSREYPCTDTGKE